MSIEAEDFIMPMGLGFLGGAIGGAAGACAGFGLGVIILLVRKK
jgi:hypothetical protein